MLSSYFGIEHSQSAPRLRVAVIGAGISGNVTARLLHDRHEVHLFESSNYAGGHAQTIEANVAGQVYQVDTGFMVFNERTYPGFCTLLKALHTPAQDSDMSFSVSCERTGLEYQGSSLSGLYAQWRNFLSPGFQGMLLEILRFNRLARKSLSTADTGETLGEFLKQHRFSPRMQQLYLLPMTAAIWSVPPAAMASFPARFLFNFLQNHGLLQIFDRPQWKTIRGGSQQYVASLLAPLVQLGRVHLNSPVLRVIRLPDGVVVKLVDGRIECFDAVVLATHADISLQLLADADSNERKLLSTFAYQPNEAVLHTDLRLLPQSRRAWASWNYRIPASKEHRVSVTYDVSRLQRLPSPTPLLVTLNSQRPISQEFVLRKMLYHHPVFSQAAIDSQRQWNQINGVRRTYFCGAYWRHGFHEDGVQSALAVCRKLTDQLAHLPPLERVRSATQLGATNHA